ncbi:MAG: hypothetical protein IKA65_04060 [Lentisphaeria bacterium]|nr:hypothetical protein [Lentisphaeria bacterium]
MKKFAFFGFVLLAFLASWRSTAAEPEDFVPAQSPVLCRVDARKLLAIPELRELISSASQDGKKALSVVEYFEKNYNITPETVFAGQVWAAKTGAADTDAALYIKTALKEAKLAEIFADKAKNSKNFAFNATTLAGEKVYTIAPVNAAKEKQPPLAIVYLAEDVILFTPLTTTSAMTLTASRQGGKNPLLKLIDRRKLAAVYAQMDGEKEKIRVFDLQADVKDPVKRDLTLFLNLTCKDKEYALQTAMQMQFMVPGALGMLFGNDPLLVSSLVNGFRVKPDGKKIVIRWALSKSDQTKLIKYFADPNNRQTLINTSGIGPAVEN